MKMSRTVVGTLGAGVIVLSLCAGAWAAMTRHEVIQQYSWDAKKGIFIELSNDQAKDDVVAPLKTTNLAVNIGEGEKWYNVSTGFKWEMGKDYAAKFVMLPDRGELWLDGKRKNWQKMKYEALEGELSVNGVPDWAPGAAAYKVLVKSLKVTTKGGESWEAELDPASFESNQRPAIVKDWQMPEGDNEFTVEFTFAFAPAD